jgi:hypothetical protein
MSGIHNIATILSTKPPLLTASTIIAVPNYNMCLVALNILRAMGSPIRDYGTLIILLFQYFALQLTPLAVKPSFSHNLSRP